MPQIINPGVSNGRETRESGDNLTKSTDGGGPFQRYGQREGEDPQPVAQTGGWLGDAGRDEYAVGPQGKWPEDGRRTRPRPQVKDDGGNT